MTNIATHIHADGTYKVIWQGHTLLVAGTTDQVINYKTKKVILNWYLNWYFYQLTGKTVASTCINDYKKGKEGGL